MRDLIQAECLQVNGGNPVAIGAASLIGFMVGSDMADSKKNLATILVTGAVVGEAMFLVVGIATGSTALAILAGKGLLAALASTAIGYTYANAI
jgi:hypothetical protein